jgi:hypothetical protein
MEDVQSLVWGEIFEVEVWGVNAWGERCFIVPRHVLFNVGEGDKS